MAATASRGGCWYACFGLSSAADCWPLVALSGRERFVLRRQRPHQQHHVLRLGRPSAAHVPRRRRLAASQSGNSVAPTVPPRIINGDWWQEACSMFDASFEGAKGVNLLQLLHTGAKIFETAVERGGDSSFWLFDKLTGLNRKASAKMLSYQLSVLALLQAVMEVASRGENRDSDVHVFVQRSLEHQCEPLEESAKKLLGSRDLATRWEPLPVVVTSLVNILEKDPQFAAVTSIDSAVHPRKDSDVALLKLAVSTCAAAMKLGSVTISCPAFWTTLLDEVGRLMNMLAEQIPISEVCALACNLGLRREFLSYFGSRGANNVYNQELGAEERLFWVELCEQHIRNGLVRERVLLKLKPYDTAEALERDLAVFGFFAALGRNARAYLNSNGVKELDETISSLLRYLEGGAVLFYPQLSTLTYYQLFVEVVCEEMEWLPAFPKAPASPGSTGPRLDNSGSSFYTVLNVCARWITDFLKYSAWVHSPSGSRLVDFLLKCQSRLLECREALNIDGMLAVSRDCLVENGAEQLRLLYEDLQSMEEALCKLESLLQDANKSENFAAARKDLEKIRRLKEEAEALEASYKARAEGKVLEACSELALALASVNPENEKPYTDVFNKSIEKLKEASADLWRGTQLLGTDVASATVLLKNGAFGQRLTEREKKMLRRTFTDLASVIPIGFLMLLPVTAVGHAAMLAAIQKYVPALIPSAYARERLDLLRQLEKVKQMADRSGSDNEEASE